MSQIVQWQGVWLDGYKYPDWAEVFGWMFAAASVIWIPGYAIYEIRRTEGLSLIQASLSIYSNLRFKIE